MQSIVDEIVSKRKTTIEKTNRDNKTKRIIFEENSEVDRSFVQFHFYIVYISITLYILSTCVDCRNKN